MLPESRKYTTINISEGEKILEAKGYFNLAQKKNINEYVFMRIVMDNTTHRYQHKIVIKIT